MIFGSYALSSLLFLAAISCRGSYAQTDDVLSDPCYNAFAAYTTCLGTSADSLSLNTNATAYVAACSECTAQNSDYSNLGETDETCEERVAINCAFWSSSCGQTCHLAGTTCYAEYVASMLCNEGVDYEEEFGTPCVFECDGFPSVTPTTGSNTSSTGNNIFNGGDFCNAEYDAYYNCTGEDAEFDATCDACIDNTFDPSMDPTATAVTTPEEECNAGVDKVCSTLQGCETACTPSKNPNCKDAVLNYNYCIFVHIFNSANCSLECAGFDAPSSNGGSGNNNIGIGGSGSNNNNSNGGSGGSSSAVRPSMMSDLWSSHGGSILASVMMSLLVYLMK